jgi:hypothetical protein
MVHFADYWAFEYRTIRKIGRICPVFEWSTSLDRFIKKRVIKNILFMPKQSRLVRKCQVRFSNGKNKMATKLAAILFLPFEIQTNSLDFEWSGQA